MGKFVFSKFSKFVPRWRVILLGQLFTGPSVFCAWGSHLHTKVVRMLVIKNSVKGSIFDLVALSKFLENRMLFRLSFDV